jgi:hypothetical protein
MKTAYLITMEAVLPVIAKIYVEAENEWEASALAERIAESQKPGLKATAFQIEAYPTDFLTVGELSEITAVDPDGRGKIWKREEIEELIETGIVDCR